MNVQHLALGMAVEARELRGAVEWAQRSVRVFGKVHPQPRLTRWYGDVPYKYSGLVWEPSEMPAIVENIRRQVEARIGERFNSVLCNLYRDGSDSVGWHADDEPLFGGDPVVASVSVGAARLFKMRRNDSSATQDILLESGSLFVMGRGVQRDWKHAIPKTTRPCGERINLTFRQTA